MGKLRIATAAIAALALLSTACAASDGVAEATLAASATTPLEVTLTDFAISPADLAVPADEPVSVRVTNAGQSPHTYGVRVGDQTYETSLLDPGGSEVLVLPALEAGSYEALCTVPGHDRLGMVGTVTAGGGASTGATATPHDHASMTAEEMAAGHERGVQDFLAGGVTDTRGGRPLTPTIVDGIKVFELTVSEIRWEVEAGRFEQALAFNGQVPGPEIRVRRGDRVRFLVHNQMSQPFALHFHGVTVPNDQDGVPFVTQPPIMPGEYWTYEFQIVDPPGLYVYHSHFNAAEQVSRGLYGALIVEPPRGEWRSVYGVEPDVEFTMFLGDGPLGYTLNGKSFPATEPIVAGRGDVVLIHISNDGDLLHPMHLHGFHFLVVGKDGFPLSREDRYLADTLVVAPGERYDLLVRADLPGAWAFHCHVLTHVEGPSGMFGMVTALVVE
ncbi:MAG: hypothetical protein KatS3mg013_0929 [Actinomycetota bacterium]|jgi:uncharacterized cupredoxin-like copper-binding protein|nr:MAG: hypothetical protein KatS3mg013_0929 [Actinomycetota bacterium]